MKPDITQLWYREVSKSSRRFHVKRMKKTSQRLCLKNPTPPICTQMHFFYRTYINLCVCTEIILTACFESGIFVLRQWYTQSSGLIMNLTQLKFNVGGFLPTGSLKLLPAAHGGTWTLFLLLIEVITVYIWHLIYSLKSEYLKQRITSVVTVQANYPSVHCNGQWE